MLLLVNEMRSLQHITIPVSFLVLAANLYLGLCYSTMKLFSLHLVYALRRFASICLFLDYIENKRTLLLRPRISDWTDLPSHLCSHIKPSGVLWPMWVFTPWTMILRNQTWAICPGGMPPMNANDHSSFLLDFFFFFSSLAFLSYSVWSWLSVFSNIHKLCQWRLILR